MLWSAAIIDEDPGGVAPDLPTKVILLGEKVFRRTSVRYSAALIALGLLIQCVEEALSTLQILCKPHPRLGKIGKMLS